MSRDDPTSREARRQIEEARELLNSPTLDASRRRELESRIEEAEAALATYRRTVNSTSSAMTPMVAQVGTQARGPVTGIAVTLFALVSWLLASISSRDAANEQAAEALGEALSALRDAVMATVNIAAIADMMVALRQRGWERYFRTQTDPGGDWETCFLQFATCLVEGGFQVAWVAFEGQSIFEVIPDNMQDVWFDCAEEFAFCMDTVSLH